MGFKMDLNKMNSLEKIAKVWQIQLNLEYCNVDDNTRLSFKDIGSFCELLATKYNIGFVGCGSGGMGFDLVNYKTKKAVEVKSCCQIQNSKCNSCGTKFNSLFVCKCPKCGSKSYKDISDSRFGIDAKEFLRQYYNGTIENFTLCYISLVNINKKDKKVTIKLEWFKVEFDDNRVLTQQIQYFTNQNELGKKAHCNLLPYSYDFYKLCPTKIDDINIVISYDDLNINPVIIPCKYDSNIKVPISVIPTTNRYLFEMLSTFQNNFADIQDFTRNMPYKEKSLGKERGDTRTKVDSALK